MRALANNKNQLLIIICGHDGVITLKIAIWQFRLNSRRYFYFVKQHETHFFFIKCGRVLGTYGDF